MSVHDTGAGRSGRGPRGRKNLRKPLLPGQGPLTGVRPVAVFAVVAAVFAVAVVVGGVLGAVLLGVLALGVVGLLAATWSRLTPGQRAGRMLIVAILVLVGFGLVTRGGLAG